MDVICKQQKALLQWLLLLLQRDESGVLAEDNGRHELHLQLKGEAIARLQAEGVLPGRLPQGDKVQLLLLLLLLRPFLLLFFFFFFVFLGTLSLLLLLPLEDRRRWSPVADGRLEVRHQGQQRRGRRWRNLSWSWRRLVAAKEPRDHRQNRLVLVRHLLLLLLPLLLLNEQVVVEEEANGGGGLCDHAVEELLQPGGEHPVDGRRRRLPHLLFDDGGGGGGSQQVLLRGGGGGLWRLWSHYILLLLLGLLGFIILAASGEQLRHPLLDPPHGGNVRQEVKDEQLAGEDALEEDANAGQLLLQRRQLASFLLLGDVFGVVLWNGKSLGSSWLTSPQLGHPLRPLLGAEGERQLADHLLALAQVLLHAGEQNRIVVVAAKNLNDGLLEKVQLAQLRHRAAVKGGGPAISVRRAAGGLCFGPILLLGHSTTAIISSSFFSSSSQRTTLGHLDVHRSAKESPEGEQSLRPLLRLHPVVGRQLVDEILHQLQLLHDLQRWLLLLLPRAVLRLALENLQHQVLRHLQRAQLQPGPSGQLLATEEGLAVVGFGFGCLADILVDLASDGEDLLGGGGGGVHDGGGGLEKKKRKKRLRCALLSCCRQTDWNWLSVKVTRLDSGVIGSVWKRVTSAAAAAASASANSRPFRVDSFSISRCILATA
ncbi:hypothetical protein TYRP_013776 [Tyrophagus putrescentiae]|nr:hypothetical protein TYRP_013776 [Tyrophagus putrescentiae]